MPVRRTSVVTPAWEGLEITLFLPTSELSERQHTNGGVSRFRLDGSVHGHRDRWQARAHGPPRPLPP